MSEHLPPHNKALQTAARQVAKEKGYKFVWSRGRRIYMHKDIKSRYILIQNMSALVNIN